MSEPVANKVSPVGDRHNNSVGLLLRMSERFMFNRNRHLIEPFSTVALAPLRYGLTAGVNAGAQQLLLDIAPALGSHVLSNATVAESITITSVDANVAENYAVNPDSFIMPYHDTTQGPFIATLQAPLANPYSAGASVVSAQGVTGTKTGDAHPTYADYAIISPYRSSSPASYGGPQPGDQGVLANGPGSPYLLGTTGGMAPPSATIQAGAGTGASARVSPQSTRIAGQISITTGTGLAGSGPYALVQINADTSSGAFTTPLNIQLTSTSASAAAVAAYVVSTTAGWMLNTTTLLASTTYSWNWHAA